MSQHHFLAFANGAPVVIQTGWDRPLQGFYFCAFTGVDDVVYSNLEDHSLKPWGGLPPSYAHFRQIASQLGFEVPPMVLDEVLDDARRNAGNRAVYYVAGEPCPQQSFREAYRRHFSAGAALG
jgi:hypothetical protein